MKLKIINIVFLSLILALSIGTSRAMAQVTKPAVDVDVKAGMRNDRKEMSKDMKENFKERRAELQASTTLTKREIKTLTTDMFRRMKDDKKVMMKNMKMKDFEVRKDTLVLHLNTTITNLLNIRARISDRIIKLEADGKTMTEAKAALVNADAKIAKAKIAVEALGNYKYASANTTASSTAEVSLEKPRQVGDAAIKAVKEARDALKLIIKWITPAGENTGAATSTSVKTSTN